MILFKELHVSENTLMFYLLSINFEVWVIGFLFPRDRCKGEWWEPVPSLHFTLSAFSKSFVNSMPFMVARTTWALVKLYKQVVKGTLMLTHLMKQISELVTGNQEHMNRD